jgi:hypothetical protein
MRTVKLQYANAVRVAGKNLVDQARGGASGKSQVGQDKDVERGAAALLRRGSL